VGKSECVGEIVGAMKATNIQNGGKECEEGFEVYGKKSGRPSWLMLCNQVNARRLSHVNNQANTSLG
jgi:hypothetical protein